MVEKNNETSETSDDAELAVGQASASDLAVRGDLGPFEARLATAFKTQAEEFEPSANSYAKVAEAVVQASEKPKLGYWRPMGLGAVGLAAVAIVGGLVATNQGGDSLGTVGSTFTSGDTANEANGKLDTNLSKGSGTRSSIGGFSVPSGGSDFGVSPGETMIIDEALVGPEASTRLAAAEQFLELLGIEFAKAVSETSDGVETVVVKSFAAGADDLTAEAKNPTGQTVATLQFVKVGDKFSVVSASSQSVSIDKVGIEKASEGLLTVAGSGTGFEATVVAELVSNLDGNNFAIEAIQAGNFGKQGEFEVEMSVSDHLVGYEEAWVMVSSLGGADSVQDPFAANLVSYLGPFDTTEYKVTGIRADDPDGGLVVRSGPGRSFEQVGVLPAGSEQIFRDPTQPRSKKFNNEVWWSIELASGETGWVYSVYLTPAEELTFTETFETSALGFRGLTDIDSESGEVSFMNFSPQGVKVGWFGDVQSYSKTEIETPSTWLNETTFGTSAGGEPDYAGTLYTFFNAQGMSNATVLSGEELTDFENDPNFVEVAKIFGDAPHVVLDATTGAPTRVIIFFDNAQAGSERHEVVGIIAAP